MDPLTAPEHDMTPVEVAASTLAGNLVGSLAEWKAALLAGLALGFELPELVIIGRKMRTPVGFGEALGVASKVAAARHRPVLAPHRRLIVRSWPGREAEPEA